MKFNELAKDYAPGELSQKQLMRNPRDQLIQWLKEAISSEIEEANAMILATADVQGIPSCRIVLLKEVDQSGLVFYTNYESRKGQELLVNPNAMVAFYWASQMRQICIEGLVAKIPKEASDTYFAQRPRGSQIGAWSSRQDQVVESRAVLVNTLKEYEEKFRGQTVPRPPFWGGYRLEPTRYEFWQGGENRLHNRFQYIREGSDPWKIERLSP